MNDVGAAAEAIGTVGFTLAFGGFGLLLYTYVGYPLLTAFLPRRRPAPPSSRAGRPVSVVIASRAARELVAEKVDWLLDNTDSLTDVVVVLDGSDPEAKAALSQRTSARLHVVELPDGSGKWAALNSGVAVARGEILVFADVRPRITPGAIGRLVATLNSPEVGAAAAAFGAERSARPHLLDLYWRMERWVRNNEAAFDSCIGASGCLYAVKRECWRPLPEGLLLDDVWVPMHVVRMGLRVAYVPEARVVDVPFGSDETELARKVRTLTGNYQLLLLMPWLLHPRHNRLWFQFVSHKLLRLLTPVFTAAGLLGTGFLMVTSSPTAWVSAAIIAVLAGCAVTSIRGRPLWRFGKTAVVMHVALITAIVNAIQRRWNVWEDPPRPRFSEVVSR